MEKYGNSASFHDTKLSSNGKTERNVPFNDFPSNLKEAHA